MAEHRFIEIVNWRRYQHYDERRNVVWVKVHLELINRKCKNYNRLADLSKILLVHLWMLAGDENNRIEYDVDWLQDRLNLKEPIDLQPLFDGGFIRLCDGVTGEAVEPEKPPTETETEPVKKPKPKPKADPLEALPILRERFQEIADAIVARHPGAVLPPKGSPKFRAIRTDLERLVRLDGLGESDIADSLVWLFTTYKAYGAFDLSQQFQRLSALRPSKMWSTGESKMEFLIRNWRDRPTRKREEQEKETIAFERGTIDLLLRTKAAEALAGMSEYKQEDIILAAENDAPMLRGAHVVSFDGRQGRVTLSMPMESGEIEEWLKDNDIYLIDMATALESAIKKYQEGREK
jgi:hypothetical protein